MTIQYTSAIPIQYTPTTPLKTKRMKKKTHKSKKLWNRIFFNINT